MTGDKPTPPSPEEIKTNWQKLWSSIIEWFHDLIDLREGMDQESTVIAIRNGRHMRGANAWMLICSIMIASLGLDLDSSAVIIGAMLISPLMSPILGIGLGVSINDQDTLFTSLIHFGISIAIALITSTLYFYLTPLGTFTSMIEARTEPTFFDSLVAIFGGLAGIISVTRKDKSNAIPGVAIATALMPPLCVTGYGIAKGDAGIALSSFYLFFLNSFFIALTSYFIIRFLQFPFRKHPDPAEARRTRIAVGLFSLLIIIPGLLILQDVVTELRYQQSLKNFVNEEFGTDCLNFKTFPITEDSNLLIVELLNRDVNDSLLQVYNDKLHENPRLESTQLRIIPDYQLELERLDDFGTTTQIDQLAEQLEGIRLQQKQAFRQDSMKAMQNQQTYRKLDSLQLARLTASLKLADQFTNLDTIHFGLTHISDFQKMTSPIPLFLAHWSNNPNRKARKQQDNNLKKYVTAYLSTHAIELDTFVVHSY